MCLLGRSWNVVRVKGLEDFIEALFSTSMTYYCHCVVMNKCSRFSSKRKDEENQFLIHVCISGKIIVICYIHLKN